MGKHLLQCEYCGNHSDKVINYDDMNLCKACFLDKKLDEAIDQFEDESFDWYDYDD